MEGHHVVELDDVLVEKARAAVRDRRPDGLGRVGAMDAQKGVAPLGGVKIERARAQRVVGAARHPGLGVWGILLGIALDHLGGGRPARPFLLGAHDEHARLVQARPADAARIADGRQVGPGPVQGEGAGIEMDLVRRQASLDADDPGPEVRKALGGVMRRGRGPA